MKGLIADIIYAAVFFGIGYTLFSYFGHGFGG